MNNERFIYSRPNENTKPSYTQPHPRCRHFRFINGIIDSVPFVIGQLLPVAFAFGLSAVKLGFSPLESLFFSCIIYIYAGARQFVITALLSAGMSLWVYAALTVMVMDARHSLYGSALHHRIVSIYIIISHCYYLERN